MPQPRIPARLRPDRYVKVGHSETLGESTLWPAGAAVTAAGLYATMPVHFVAGSGGFISVVRWIVPVLVVALVIPLVATAPHLGVVPSLGRRAVTIAVIAIIALANAVSILLIVRQVVTGHEIDAPELLRAAIHIWCVNVIVFALAFWQVDGGGPVARLAAPDGLRDFLFPQSTNRHLSPPGWRAEFLDYLYVSFTNSVAFSPTDAAPLTRHAKMLMLTESATSLLLLVMVAARAVNLLE